MRILHATDFHVESESYREAWRHVGWMGAAYLWSKRRQYDHRVREQLVREALRLQPDLLVLTGDLTSQNLEGEFRRAARLLAPAFERIPALVLAGNHDVSTPGPAAERPFTRHFRPWMHLAQGDYPARLDIGGTTVLALDAALPPRFDASGEVPAAQLDRLRALLDGPDLDGRSIVLCQHYPLFGADGGVYRHPRHGLRNVDALLDVLRGARHVPAAILHGHLHAPSHHRWECGGRTVHVLNPGAACYGGRGPRKTRFSLYELAPSGLQVRHWRWHRGGFIQEDTSVHANDRLATA